MTSVQRDPRTEGNARHSEHASLTADRTVIPPSGFARLSERTAARPTGRQIMGFLALSLALAALLGQAGFFGFSQFTDEWRARSEVQYRGSAWTETQNVAVQSRTITGPVATEFGIPIKDFEEDLESGLIPGTQVLRIDYVSPDRDLAQNVVAAIAQGYIDESSELAPEQLQEILQAERDSVASDLAEAEARLQSAARDDSAAGQVEQQAAQALVNSIRSRLDNAELRLLDAELDQLDDSQMGVPFVITEPFVFDDPVFPRPKIMGAVGAVGGLLLGLMALVIYWNVLAFRAESDRY